MSNKIVVLFAKLDENRDAVNMYYCECSKYMFNLKQLAHDLLLKDKALRLDCNEWMLYSVFELKDFYRFRLWEEMKSPGGCYTEITEDMCKVLTPKEMMAEALGFEGEQ